MTRPAVAKPAAAGEGVAPLAAEQAKQANYGEYLEKATDAKVLFESLTGRQVTDEQLKPSVTI